MSLKPHLKRSKGHPSFLLSLCLEYYLFYVHFVLLYVFCLHVCMGTTCVSGAQGGQKRCWSPWSWSDRWSWLVLGSKPRSSVRTASVPKCWATSWSLFIFWYVGSYGGSGSVLSGIIICTGRIKVHQGCIRGLVHIFLKRRFLLHSWKVQAYYWQGVKALSSCSLWWNICLPGC